MHAADRLSRAERLLTDVMADPRGALAAADELVAERRDDEAAPVALRVRALALRAVGDLTSALDTLRGAVALAVELGAARRAAEARMSLVVLLAEVGSLEGALAEADAAAQHLDGIDASRLEAQRGLVLQRAGRSTEALEAYARALPAIRAAGDVVWEARMLGNRGALFAYHGRFDEARADLERSITLARRHGLFMQLQGSLQNLGFAAMRAGDLPRALQLYDESSTIRDRFGLASAGEELDRADALLLAGLSEEAVAAAREALTDILARGFSVDVPEARLMLARALLVAGDAEGARRHATEAWQEFDEQGRKPWSRLAQVMEVRSRWEAGERTRELMESARAAGDAAVESGWHVAATEARLVAGRVGLALGRLDEADETLAQVAARRDKGAATIRVNGWHAEAFRRHMRGDREGTFEALREGLNALSEDIAAYGATDLRASAATRGTELARLGVQLCAEDGSAEGVLEWSESWRAGALRQRPVRPPSDEELAADLAALRRVVGEIHDLGLADQDTEELFAERERLERAVRDRSRHARGSYAAPPPFDLHELTAALGERALVEYLRDGDDLLAVSLVDGEARLHRLGHYVDTTRELESLRFALNRLARGTGSPILLETAADTRRYAADVLEALLLEPLREQVGDRELVVVPTGMLHALPWAVLPSCAHRPVTVAPSARVWLSAATAAPPPDSPAQVLLAAGPRLEHAADEVHALHSGYPSARVLLGRDATADAVLQGMDGADVAHVVAHGRFRLDNPLFSCLELADGPLTVYDLEGLGRAPRRLVLSACDSALADVRAGDELMGLASAVLALGTQTLVAATCLVDDEGTRKLMEFFHERLCAGDSPARALADATSATGVDGFVCFGLG
ncbi:CHAT domain-containing protein [Motilibacter aurantiacus]|uniref:CHAT domain-containing protein n=1 Tax=Motilibacter aurantiacus TaxID=2714955 RepID=UPI00140E27C7|nr:CHAT domain-containing protein [Motilibacter aurantiacus]